MDNWRATLTDAHCWEPRVDRVARDPQTTAFKQTARLHQARWREQRGYPMGTHPYQPTAGKSQRFIGSRLDHDFALETGSNLLSPEALNATRERLENRQPHQMLNTDRVWCDLLSSMPLCFNLFGPLTQDSDLARQAVQAWFPDAPGQVERVYLEWSPGRLDPGYLGNRTAFDAAIELRLDDGSFGLIGVETKYHEHLKPEQLPSPERRRRYREVAQISEVFVTGAADAIEGAAEQQIWQDHLLALSMKQHPSRRWTWVRFLLVYPDANPSFTAGIPRYRSHLTDQETFEARTLQSLLQAEGALPPSMSIALSERYTW